METLPAEYVHIRHKARKSIKSYVLSHQEATGGGGPLAGCGCVFKNLCPCRSVSQDHVLLPVLRSMSWSNVL